MHRSWLQNCKSTFKISKVCHTTAGEQNLRPPPKRCVTFANTITEEFSAEMDLIDSASSAAIDVINDWVENKTEGKIKELLRPGFVNAATGLVLISTNFFEGAWFFQFRESATVSDVFYKSDGQTVEVKNPPKTRV
jgi:serine protease inhibitor